ncbi:MAG: ATP-binding protein [Oscillospiraceae bacterium]|nr:ATP-binding protein [Oscillospiraceae bacterium]
MNYDRDILERVLREVENKKIKTEAAAEQRRREVYERLPRIAEIDASLRTTVLDIIRASFGKGEDTAALIRRAHEKNSALVSEREAILTGAGLPSDCTEPKYSCDICSDEGYTGGELCPCVIKKYRAAVAEEINSRLILREHDFDSFDLSLYPEAGVGISPRAQMREVYDFCRNYATSFEDMYDSLFMTGESGLGKTFLASCIARKVADSGFSVVFETAFSVLGAYEDLKFGREGADTSVFESCDLLILDDVGSEMPTPFASAALFNLINLRRNSDRKTIIISSLKKPELIKRYGKQMLSRLEGDFVKLEFLGEDVRLMR